MFTIVFTFLSATKTKDIIVLLVNYALFRFLSRLFQKNQNIRLTHKNTHTHIKTKTNIFT